MADFNYEEYSDVFEDTQEPLDFEALSDIFEDTGVPTEEMAFESAMKARETSTATRSLTKEERAAKFPPVVQEPDEEIVATPIDSQADALISSVFKAEGGYSTDKLDTGNYYSGKFVGTNHGISAPTLAAYLGRTPTVADMKGLDKQKAREIAKNQYFDRFNISTLPADLQEIVFHAVFMGETRGVRAMQNLLGLTPDGIMGPNTKKAMAKASFTKEQYKDEYLRELEFGTPTINPTTSIPYSKPSATWGARGKGWTNRYEKLARN